MRQPGEMLALSFEFRGEVWAGDSNVEVTDTDRHLKPQDRKLVWRYFGLIFLFDPSVSAQILAQREAS